MHGMSDTGVPAFLSKLWTLVEDPSTDSMISWDASGTSFHVLDQTTLAREELPRYFKHNNIASFVRQLNMYGFRKKMHIESGGLKIEKDDMEFQHPYFLRDQIELLEHIKRKVTSGPKPEEVRIKHDDVSRVLGDVKQIKGRQESLSSKLDLLKRENEALWREVANLRQKHAKQGHVVNKLIQFLLSLVRTNHTAMPGTKRRLPMLNDSSQLQSAKVPKLSGHNEYKGAAQSTESGPNGTNLLKLTGPTIHDITDLQEQTSPQGPTDSDSVPKLSEPTSVEPYSGLDDPIIFEDYISTDSTVDIDSSEKLAMKLENPATVSNFVKFEKAEIQPQNPATVSNFVKFEKAEIQPQNVKLKSTGSHHHRPLTPLVIPPHNVVNLEDLVDMPSAFDSQNILLIPGGAMSPTRAEVTEDLLFLDNDLDSIKQLLATGALNLDSSILTGLFTPEAPLPATPDHLLEMDKVPLPATATATQLSGTIVGNELMQYIPQDTSEQDNLLSLFDLGDMPNDSLLDEDHPRVPPLSLVEDDEIETPDMALATPSFTNRERATNLVSTEDVD